MKKMAPVWFWLCIKRLLVRKSFVAFILLLPVLAVGVQAVHSAVNKGSIEVGLCWQGDEGLASDAGKYLTMYEGSVTFLPYEDVDDMKNDIRANKVQWGYAFTEDMEQRMARKDAQRSIICYETPASFLSKLTDEIVFSAIIRNHGETILLDYAHESGIFSTRQLTAADRTLPQAYKEYRDGSDTFSFVYKTLDGAVDTENVITAPIRGLCAVLILIGGMFGGMTVIENERLGIYKRFSPAGRAIGGLLAVLAPVLLLAVSSLLTLLLSGGGQECISLAAYSVGVAGFCYFLAVLCRRESVLCGAIPVLTMGSLLCCPIFFDVSLFLPATKAAAWLFLPYYYLTGLSFILVLIGLLFTAMGMFLSFKR